MVDFREKRTVIYQRELAVAIKRALHMALLPFVKE